MNSFLKSVHSKANRRNNLVKDSLQKQLNLSVMEMQGITSGGLPVGNCEESMSLCSVLEAVFLHGLKDSLLNRVTEVLGGPDFEAMPQPSFWGPLLVFSHREMIDQIQSMRQINTEVGYCRVWIRLALNEGLLSSYFSSIRRENSALKPYYERAAFIRDADLVDVAQRLVESLDPVTFNLACNSSLLNFWSSTPLLMAAIWSPPMKSCPVFSAVDIAKTISSEASDNFEDDVETASSIGSLSSLNSSQSMLNNVASLSEDEALKIILKQDLNNPASRQSNSSSPSIMIKRVYKQKKLLEQEKRAEEAPSRTTVTDEKSEKTDEKEGLLVAASQDPRENENEIPSTENKIDTIGEAGGQQGESDRAENVEVAPGTIGNSLIGRPGWSTAFEDGESSMTASMISRGSGMDAPQTPGEGTTYDALIKSYHTAGHTTLPDLDDFLEKSTDVETLIQPEPKIKPKIKVLENFDEQIGNIPREKGLDVQNYSCFECGHPIGMTFSRAHVCSFTGNYYCADCMANEEFLIPSRIIHNWDLKHYPVCRRVANYLTDCPTLLNLKTLNPRIYMAVDSMAQLQSLRIRLNLLRAYLFTCREPIIESLQKRVTPREYLYEHVHQYSVSDLLDVPSGALAQQLQKVVDFARQHVLNCWLCSQKGFICEVCNNPKVIYPFDMESTYRCNVCNAVFHADCQSSSKPCPKCERRRKRVDRPPPEIDNVEFFSETLLTPSTSAI